MLMRMAHTRDAVLQYWGHRIKIARMEMDMSLNALAVKAGINGGNLSRIENGKQDAKPETRERIALALDREVIDLWAPTGSGRLARSA